MLKFGKHIQRALTPFKNDKKFELSIVREEPNEQSEDDYIVYFPDKTTRDVECQVGPSTCKRFTRDLLKSQHKLSSHKNKIFENSEELTNSHIFTNKKSSNLDQNLNNRMILEPTLISSERISKFSYQKEKINLDN